MMYDVGFNLSPRDAAQIVRTKLPPGTRLRCEKNGKTYQMGTAFRRSEYWMMDEAAGTKGLVSAMTICHEFTKIED